MDDFNEAQSIARSLRQKLTYLHDRFGVDYFPQTQPKLREKKSMPSHIAENQAAKLKIIHDDNKDCKRCILACGAKSFVFGSGCSAASVLWIGEGPGGEEDEQGKPFVGSAGELLDKMIEAMVHEAYKRLRNPEAKGVDFEALLKAHVFKRQDSYIANVVKHRPPNNRKPEPDEISQCMPILKDQIEALQDSLQVIITLGATASNSLLQKMETISSLRGTWHEYKLGNGKIIPVMPTFHPSYLLRKPSEKGKVWADLQMVITRIIGK